MSRSRVTAEPIYFHDARVCVEWRDLGYDSGIAIRVDVKRGGWTEVAKLDAFVNRPHLHIFTRSGREFVESINGADGVAWCIELIRDLADLLDRGGHDGVADQINSDEVSTLLIPAVVAAIREVDPSDRKA